MTSPTATARPWATPRSRPAARAREETRSRTKTVGPGLRDTPAEGGSVSQISASARQSARRQGIRPSSQGVDPIEAGSRGGETLGGGQRRRRSAGRAGPRSDRRGPARGRTRRCRRRCSASAGQGRPAGPSARRRLPAVSSGRTDPVCNPAVRAAAFGRRPGRRAGVPTGSRDGQVPHWTNGGNPHSSARTRTWPGTRRRRLPAWTNGEPGRRLRGPGGSACQAGRDLPGDVLPGAPGNGRESTDLRHLLGEA